MPDETRTSEPLDELQATLAKLTPAPVTFSREQLLYEAGRAAGLSERSNTDRAVRRWLSLSAAALVVLSLTMTTLWLRQRQAAPIVREEQRDSVDDVRPDDIETERVNESHAAEDFSAYALTQPNGYLQLRRAVLEEGVEALPVFTSPPRSDGGATIPSWRSSTNEI